MLVVSPEEYARLQQSRVHVLLNAKDEVSAEALVTGNADLLILNPYEGTPIVTPADYLAIAPRLVSPAAA